MNGILTTFIAKSPNLNILTSKRGKKGSKAFFNRFNKQQLLLYADIRKYLLSK